MLLPHTQPGAWPDTIPPARFAAGIRRDAPHGCRIALLGLPDDTGVRLNHGRLGAAGGPAAFRSALARYGAAQDSYPLVFDAGDIVPGATLAETHDRVTAATAVLLDLGLLPVGIGGGHDLTYPFARAAVTKFNRPAGLYFDAHLDVRETPGSGMAFRRLVEECEIPSMHLHGFRTVVNSREHLDWFTDHGGRIYPDNAAVALPPAHDLFVSFDLDVLDSSQAPGVSAPNPAGWMVRQAEHWILACGAAPSVRCFDLMELNPLHDQDGRTARVAAHLFLTFLAGFTRR